MLTPNALENRNKLISWCILCWFNLELNQSSLLGYMFCVKPEQCCSPIFHFNSNLLHAPLPSYLLLSSRHVGRLLRVKRIGNTAHHKDVKLEPLLSLLFLPLHLFQIILFLVDRHWGARARWTGIGASAWLQPTGAFAGPAWRHPRTTSLGRRHHFALFFHNLLRLLLAGWWVQHFNVSSCFPEIKRENSSGVFFSNKPHL